jgi:hypothetical protein
MGTAMPPPPQLWHLVQPDLLQELQPTSPSDHLVQKHGWTPEPPQLGQGLSEASKRSWSSNCCWLRYQAPTIRAEPTIVTGDKACGVMRACLPGCDRKGDTNVLLRLGSLGALLLVCTPCFCIMLLCISCPSLAANACTPVKWA